MPFLKLLSGCTINALKDVMSLAGLKLVRFSLDASHGLYCMIETIGYVY